MKKLSMIGLTMLCSLVLMGCSRGNVVVCTYEFESGSVDTTRIYSDSDDRVTSMITTTVFPDEGVDDRVVELDLFIGSYVGNIIPGQEIQGAICEY